MDRIFEWDNEKAKINVRKHGVRFEDAILVFNDPNYITVQDRFENGEFRWQTTGRIGDYTVLLVAHTTVLEDEGVEIIRVISARRADKKERARYERG